MYIFSELHLASVGRMDRRGLCGVNGESREKVTEGSLEEDGVTVQDNDLGQGLENFLFCFVCVILGI
jgi:hypothetical protein